MAAEAQAEVQALLAFLTRDAKIPLATALPKYNLLRKHGLTTPDTIAKADAGLLRTIFDDDKVVKQVLSAAKKSANPKKRAASSSMVAPRMKQAKGAVDNEAELNPPQSSMSIEDIANMTVETNRAPLFLAFAFCLTKYTLPDQPVSSRLSLAQAVTSAGAQSKAKFIGLTDSTAEDEGWAQGQPKVKLMGREIAVMRRHVAVPVKDEANDGDEGKVKIEESDKIKEEPSAMVEAFWGIDLEALRKTNGPLVSNAKGAGMGPPIFRPEGARAYMLKSIDLVESDEVSGEGYASSVKMEETKSPAKGKKSTLADRAARREQAVAITLKAIDHLCATWASALTNDELDRRATAWYAKVRPEIEPGQAGWGQRGKVSLRSIIDLARDPP